VLSEIVMPAQAIKGETRVPGDKSITHRAVLLGAVADGESRVRGYLDSGDCRASIAAVQSLGVLVDKRDSASLVIHGRGMRGLLEPQDFIDCASSGTTMRLLAGLLAGHEMTAFLSGNESLRRRPMGRVIEPLREMGATIFARAGDRVPPIMIRGGSLRGIEYELPVASAQVKSAILLAGLFAEGRTTVMEPGPTRDHTELMLRSMGARVDRRGRSISLSPVERLEPLDIAVPGDISAAAYVIAAALIVPGSEVVIRDVGVNPTRTGFVDIIRAMGGEIEFENQRDVGGEPIADVVVRYSSLKGTIVEGDLVPRAIDELPLVAVLGAQAQGKTVVREAQELRVKESDRVATVVQELGRMGARIEERPDGFVVEGPGRLRGTSVSAHSDHRLAMALAVAALVADGSVVIEGAECTQDSFPGFFAVLDGLKQ